MPQTRAGLTSRAIKRVSSQSEMEVASDSSTPVSLLANAVRQMMASSCLRMFSPLVQGFEFVCQS